MAKRGTYKLTRERGGGDPIVGVVWGAANQQEEPIHFRVGNPDQGLFYCTINGEYLSDIDFMALQQRASDLLLQGGSYAWQDCLLIDRAHSGDGYSAPYPLPWATSLKRCQYARTAQGENLVRLLDPFTGQPGPIHRAGDRRRAVPGWIALEKSGGTHGLILPFDQPMWDTLTRINEVMDRVRTAQRAFNEALEGGAALDDPTVVSVIRLHELIGLALVGSPWENPASGE